MKIYLVSRTDKIGYDEYDAWVVVAETPAKAKALCNWADGSPSNDELRAKEIKPLKKPQVILGSFNAG